MYIWDFLSISFEIISKAIIKKKSFPKANQVLHRNLFLFHPKGNVVDTTNWWRFASPFKEVDQEYAQVTKLLGDRRILAKILNDKEESDETDSNERLCIIPGKFRKKIWINKEDIILIGTREHLNGNKCDVLYKYNCFHSTSGSTLVKLI